MIEICSSAGCSSDKNKNSSCIIECSQQPRVFILISLASGIYSMKPCNKASTVPRISSDNLNKKAIHTWCYFCLCVHFRTVQSNVVCADLPEAYSRRNAFESNANAIANADESNASANASTTGQSNAFEHKPAPSHGTPLHNVQSALLITRWSGSMTS